MLPGVVSVRVPILLIFHGCSCPVLYRKQNPLVNTLLLWHFEFFFPIAGFSLIFRYKSCVADASLGVGHPMISSLCFGQLWLSVMVSIYCESNLLYKQGEIHLSVGIKVTIYTAVNNCAGLGMWWE